MNLTELPLDLQITIWLNLRAEDLARYSQVNIQTHELYHQTDFIQNFFNRRTKPGPYEIQGGSVQGKSRIYEILTELSQLDLENAEIDPLLHVKLYPRLTDLLERTVKLGDWRILDLVLNELKSRVVQDNIAYNSSYWKAFVTALKYGDQFIFLKILDHYSPVGDPALSEFYNQASQKGDLGLIRPLAPYLKRELDF